MTPTADLPMSAVWTLLGSSVAAIAATLLVPVGEQRIARWSTIVAGTLGAVVALACSLPAATKAALPLARELWSPMGGQAGMDIILLGDAPAFLKVAFCSVLMLAACFAGASESMSHEPTRIRCARVALPLLLMGLTLWILAGSMLTRYVGGQLIVVAVLASLGGSDDPVSRAAIVARGITAQLGLALWAAASLLALRDRDIALRSIGTDSFENLQVALSPIGTQVLMGGLLLVAAFLWAGLPPFAAWSRRAETGRGSVVIVAGLAGGIPALDMIGAVGQFAPQAQEIYFDPVAWSLVAAMLWLGLAARVRDEVASRAQTLTLTWLLFAAALLRFESAHSILLSPLIVLAAVASAGAVTVACADVAAGQGSRPPEDPVGMRLLSSLHWAALAGLPGLALGTWAVLGVLGAIEGQGGYGRELHVVLLLAAIWPAAGAAATGIRGALKSERPRVRSRREQLLRRRAPLRSRSGAWAATILLTSIVVVCGIWTSPPFARGYLEAQQVAQERAWRHCVAELLEGLDRPVVPSRSTITECGPTPIRLDPDALPVADADDDESDDASADEDDSLKTPGSGSLGSGDGGEQEAVEDADADAAAQAQAALDEIDALIEQAEAAQGAAAEEGEEGEVEP